MQKNNSIYDLTRKELEEIIANFGEPSYRLDQVWQGLYKNLFDDPSKFLTLPAKFRTKLFDKYAIELLHQESRIFSSDGSAIKYLFRLSDDYPVETVLMHSGNRNAVCISSQSGCSMSCSFCATGQMGFNRNLSSGEIIQQVVTILCDLRDDNKKLTNIVFMGMGEPLNNFRSTIASINVLNDHSGLNFGERRITISTIGIVPKIYQLADLRLQVNLAISLHAANDELRSSLLPINNTFPLANLIDACIYYINQTNRRITFEWTLIDGINDTLAHAKELVMLLKGLICHVNLIPLNPTKYYHKKPSKTKSAQAFKKYLLDNHIPCTLRIRKGIDIQAGCGQLAQGI